MKQYKEHDYYTIIDIRKEWKKCKNGELSFSILATIVAEKLANVHLPKSIKNILRDDIDLLKKSLIDQFMDLGSSDNTSLKDFSDVMEKLQLWGNYIITFSSLNKNMIVRNCDILL